MLLELDQEYAFSQGRVRYGIFGSGPDVVLVHGTPWSSVVWESIARDLTQNCRVHLYDLIGYGRSEKRDGQQVSLDVQTELLVELLALWELDSPSVVAHDFGGAISLRAHLLKKLDFQSLTLIDVVALAPWGSAFFAHVREHVDAFTGVPPYIHQAIVETYIKGAAHCELSIETMANLVEPWLGSDGQAGFYRQIAQADQRFTDEVEPLYAQARCPVLIFWGTEDQWIPVETGRRLHDAIPGSMFIELANAGHLLPLEQPEKLSVELGNFLSSKLEGGTS